MVFNAHNSELSFYMATRIKDARKVLNSSLNKLNFCPEPLSYFFVDVNPNENTLNLRSPALNSGAFLSETFF